MIIALKIALALAFVGLFVSVVGLYKSVVNRNLKL